MNKNNTDLPDLVQWEPFINTAGRGPASHKLPAATTQSTVLGLSFRRSAALRQFSQVVSYAKAQAHQVKSCCFCCSQLLFCSLDGSHAGCSLSCSKACNASCKLMGFPAGDQRAKSGSFRGRLSRKQRLSKRKAPELLNIHDMI